MSCSAVGICVITDLNSRIEQRADVELAGVEQRRAPCCAIGIGIDEAELLDARAGRRARRSCAAIVAAQDVVALAADAEDLDRLAVGQQAAAHGRGRAARSCELKPPHRPRSAVQTTSRCTSSLPVPASSARRLAGAADAGRGWRAPRPCARIGPRRLGRLLRAAQLRRGDHLHRLGDLLRRLHRGDAVAEVFEAGMRQPVRRSPLKRRSWRRRRSRLRAWPRMSSLSSLLVADRVEDRLVLARA